MGSVPPFPPSPADGIDWSNLGLGNFEAWRFDFIVNGHIESRYSVTTGKWTLPKLVKDPMLRVHGLSPALNYGQQAYEGLKAYRHADGQIHIFRLQDHAQRLAHSCSYVSIPAPPTSHFEACALAALACNAEFVPPHGAGAAMYLRPVIFGVSGHLPLSPPQEYLFCIYVRPASSYLGGAGPLNALVLDEFDRAAPQGTGSAKIGGNYAPVMPWSEWARREGFALTLHLDSKDGNAIDEFSSCGFIGVQGVDVDSVGYRLVVPDSKNAVKSVTSDSCAQLAKSRGWEVVKRRVGYDELEIFDEVLAVGTAVAIASVGVIARQSTADKFVYSKDGNQGKCCLVLLHELKDIQEGVTEDRFDWLTQVRETALGDLQ